MTAHYSIAQVVEIREALEKITDEKHANNVSLASIIRERKSPPKQAVPLIARCRAQSCTVESPPKSPLLWSETDSVTF
jgi:hypothetical protein